MGETHVDLGSEGGSGVGAGGGGEASPPSPRLSGEAGLLRGMLFEEFRTATPSRAPFLGRDPAYVGQWCVPCVGVQTYAYCALCKRQVTARATTTTVEKIGKTSARD